MSTPTGARLDWEAFMKAHPFQQFGQRDDESTFNGATGCTHTDLQKLILAKTGRMYSHDEISRIAGYPNASANPGRRGLRLSTSSTSEVMKVVRAFNLPYLPYFFNGAMTSGVWNYVKKAAAMGPVMVAEKYSHHPERKGYRYNGTVADGRPNGFALLNGKTQLSGAESIAHAILWLAYWRAADGRWLVDEFDPNHGSPARPEKPPFERETTRQLGIQINSIRLLKVETSTGIKPRSLAFLIPTRTFTPR